MAKVKKVKVAKAPKAKKVKVAKAPKAKKAITAKQKSKLNPGLAAFIAKKGNKKKG